MNESHERGKVCVAHVRESLGSVLDRMDVDTVTEVYIGRAMPGHPASPLANKYRIGPDGTRAEVIRMWREEAQAWSWESDEFCYLFDLWCRVANGMNVVLRCWCHPLPCHGDVIKTMLEA